MLIAGERVGFTVSALRYHLCLTGKKEYSFFQSYFPIVILHKLTFIAHRFHEAFIFSLPVRGKAKAKIKPTFTLQNIKGN